MISVAVLGVLIIAANYPASSSSNVSWASADHFENEYHFAKDHERTFHEAIKYCKSLNSSLPQFSTLVEQNWAFDRISNKSIFWLNTRNVPFTRRFSGWLDGSRFNYTAWGWSQPNFADMCDAVVATRGGEWYDRPCADLLEVFAVCQRTKQTVQFDTRSAELTQLVNSAMNEHKRSVNESLEQFEAEMHKQKNTFEVRAEQWNSSFIRLEQKVQKMFMENLYNKRFIADLITSMALQTDDFNEPIAYLNMSIREVKESLEHFKNSVEQSKRSSEWRFGTASMDIVHLSTDINFFAVAQLLFALTMAFILGAVIHRMRRIEKELQAATTPLLIEPNVKPRISET